MCFVAHPMEIGCAQDRKVIAVNAPVELIPPTKPAAFLQRFTNLPVLSVKRTLWRMEEAEHTRNEADALFQEARKKALTRDGGRCWFCGWQSAAYQEVHHADDDHTNNHVDNLVTVCNIDHMCFHLGLAAMRGAMFLAFVPELTQAEVTNLMRLYHCKMRIGDEAMQLKLQGFHALFESRSVEVFKRVFEADFSGGHEISVALSKLDDSAFARRARTLQGLRVVPTAAAFHAGQLEAYIGRSHAAYFQPDNGAALLQQLQQE